MDKRIKVISITFVSTIVVTIVYTVYLILTLEPSASIELLFYPFFFAGWLYFIQCIILLIVYIKKLKNIWFLLLPVFLFSAPFPIYNFYRWMDSLPIKIPKPGKPPVTMQEYNNDENIIIADYKLKVLGDSIKTYRNTGDTIINVGIDTIIYSLDKSKLFSILIITTVKGTKKHYCSELRVGLKQVTGDWQITRPWAGLYTSISDSVSGLKYEQRQEYYRYYSINRSSNKSEIWTDSSYFYFPFKDTGHK